MLCPYHNIELIEDEVLVSRTTDSSEDDKFEKALICQEQDCDFVYFLLANSN